VALDGGASGLDTITLLCHQVAGKLNENGCLLLEVGQGQAQAVIALLKKELPPASIEIFRDMAGIERVIGVCLT